MVKIFWRRRVLIRKSKFGQKQHKVSGSASARLMMAIKKQSDT